MDSPDPQFGPHERHRHHQGRRGEYAGRVADYVRKLVEDTVTDERYLRKLSERVRPHAILDGKGSVLVNGGALAHLDGHPQFTPANGLLPEKVVITPRDVLSQPPLFSSLDDSTLFYIADRGQGLDWEFKLQPRPNIRVTEDSPTWTNRTYRFRLEILY